MSGTKNRRGSVRLDACTKGFPYLRDQIDPVTKREVFHGLVERALSTSEGLLAWWAHKDEVAALWSAWFASHVSAPVSGGISPINRGTLNDDPEQVAYAVQYGTTSLVVAWFKNIWQDGHPTVGMPGVQLQSPGGASRFLGFVPTLVEAGDLGLEIYGGTLAWDSLAGPLSRYILGNLAVLGKSWGTTAGAEVSAADLVATAKTQTETALAAEGKRTSDSNLNRVVGEGPGRMPVAGEKATDLAATETIAGSSAKVLGTGAETDTALTVALEGAEAAPGLAGLVAMALFTWVPTYLRGRLEYLDLRLEVVNSSTDDVVWSCVMVDRGVILQVPADPAIPAMQRLAMTGSAGQRSVLTSHAAQFELQNDTRGTQPLEMVLNLTVGEATLVAVVFISDENLSSWVGLRTGTDTDRALVDRCIAASQSHYKLPDGRSISINVATDPRPGSPPPSGSTVATYSALIHLNDASWASPRGAD